MVEKLPFLRAVQFFWSPAAESVWAAGTLVGFGGGVGVAVRDG